MRDLNCSCESNSPQHCPVHRVGADPVGRALRVPAHTPVYEWSARDKSTLIAREREALRLLGEFTAGRYDIGMLAGKYNKGQRAAILSALDGVRVPVSKAFISGIYSRFYNMAEVNLKQCQAAINEDFVQWAKS